MCPGLKARVLVHLKSLWRRRAVKVTVQSVAVWPLPREPSGQHTHYFLNKFCLQKQSPGRCGCHDDRPGGSSAFCNEMRSLWTLRRVPAPPHRVVPVATTTIGWAVAMDDGWGPRRRGWARGFPDAIGPDGRTGGVPWCRSTVFQENPVDSGKEDCLKSQDST